MEIDDSRIDDGDALRATKRFRPDEDGLHMIPTSPATTGTDPATDCYHDVCRGNGTFENEQLFSSSSSLPYEWLVEKQQDDGSRTTTMTPEQRQVLQLDLTSLKQQLTQVKRRLEPAREECAAAVNTSANNNNSNGTTTCTNNMTTPEVEFNQARSQANPMECLGTKDGLNHKLFLNRSAIKLANIDAILDFGLTTTTSTTTTTDSIVPFLFADLCGAPGGFSEYLMKRCQQQQQHRRACRGYGISLLGTNEHGQGCAWKAMKLNRRQADLHQSGTNDTFYWKSKGADGTGDIYIWDNVMHFQMEIERDLEQAGLVGDASSSAPKMDLVVGDGGFDAQRCSECQEEISQKLILCEMAAGLELLKHGGRMILKLFGCQTKSIHDAMRFMYDHFDWIQELKPISSRPASQERYAVFSGFHGLPQSWKGGPAWMGSILLGSQDVLQKDIAAYQDFDDWLHQVDRDMMRLNLKACFDILSTLERKIASLTEGGTDQYHAEGNGLDRYMEKVKEKQIIKQYRHAWELHVLRQQNR